MRNEGLHMGSGSILERAFYSWVGFLLFSLDDSEGYLTRRDQGPAVPPEHPSISTAASVSLALGEENHTLNRHLENNYDHHNT